MEHAYDVRVICQAGGCSFVSTCMHADQDAPFLLPATFADLRANFMHCMGRSSTAEVLCGQHAGLRCGWCRYEGLHIRTDEIQYQLLQAQRTEYACTVTHVSRDSSSAWDGRTHPSVQGFQHPENRRKNNTAADFANRFQM